MLLQGVYQRAVLLRCQSLPAPYMNHIDALLLDVGYVACNGMSRALVSVCMDVHSQLWA
jgi:hypothetical protein